MSVKSIIGTIGEHKVITQLMKEGYHVAKAVDPQCPFDLVDVSATGEIKLIDVKTESHRKNKPNWTKRSTKINRVLTAKQKQLNVELRMVSQDE